MLFLQFFYDKNQQIFAAIFVTTPMTGHKSSINMIAQENFDHKRCNFGAF